MESSSKRSVYGVFTGSIDTEAVQRISQQLVKFTDPRTAIESVHLLLHSPGGQIPDGVTLHNFFKAFPLKLTLYNAGNVDSAAVLAFLGAKDRRASRHAMFTIHRCSMTIDHGNCAADLHQLVKMMRLEDDRTEAIYRASNLRLTDEHWADFTNNKNLSFSAETALSIGLVQEIAEFSPPLGTTLFSL
jgi:ATP-dependent Clp protease, protease subunit